MNTEKNAVIIIFYSIINLLAFALYGTDKHKAKKNIWRISENTLFLTAFLGGAAGALCGMKYFHHKTKKSYFWVLNLIAFIIHAVLLYVFLR